MIYEILLNGKTLYYPNDDVCAVSNAVLNLALNDAGTLEFDVPYTNPLYGTLQPRISTVQVLKDKEEIFYGEVREVTDNIDFTSHVYCVGELAWLFDSIQPQMRYQTVTPLEMFSAMLTLHNAQVEEAKRFTLGVVTVQDQNDSIYHYTNYETTLDAMREKLCDTLDGYLRIRKSDGVRYLDLVRLQDYGRTCEQPIEFGYNLLEYSTNTSGTNIATACLPLGATINDEQEVEGLDTYTTIESVNDGKDYVYSAEAVQRFGWIKAVVHFDNITIPANLKREAERWLASSQFETMTLELNAVDMSMLDADLDSFDLGDTVHAIAEPFGMDTRFPVQKKTINLQDFSQNFITLSNEMKKSYTAQMASRTNEIDESIPQTATFLEQAKHNASELIKIGQEGNIYTVVDANGNPKELLIMDTKDLSTAQKVWRWNINGLGYSSNGYNGDYGLAMTMDGKIVADFITAGTLRAINVNGVTITGSTINGTAINGSTIISGNASGRNTRFVGGVIEGRTGSTVNGRIDFNDTIDNEAVIRFENVNGGGIAFKPSGRMYVYGQNADGQTAWWRCRHQFRSYMTDIDIDFDGDSLEWDCEYHLIDSLEGLIIDL